MKATFTIDGDFRKNNEVITTIATFITAICGGCEVEVKKDG